MKISNRLIEDLAKSGLTPEIFSKKAAALSTPSSAIPKKGNPQPSGNIKIRKIPPSSIECQAILNRPPSSKDSNRPPVESTKTKSIQIKKGPSSKMKRDLEEEKEELKEDIQREFMSELTDANGNALQVLDEDFLVKHLECEQSELSKMRHARLVVDLTNDSLQYVGELMPTLSSLKLNGSRIPSFRDLGTKLQGLQVLYVSQCKLTDLSGLHVCPVLKELYASFNYIKDLPDFFFNDQIEVLDLEGNEIVSVEELRNLGCLGNLVSLNLAKNPVESKREEMLSVLQATLPKLETFNEEVFDEPTFLNKKAAEPNEEPSKPYKSIVQESISAFSKMLKENPGILGKLIDAEEFARNALDSLPSDEKLLFSSEPNEDEILMESVKESLSKMTSTSTAYTQVSGETNKRNGLYGLESEVQMRPVSSYHGRGFEKAQISGTGHSKNQQKRNATGKEEGKDDGFSNLVYSKAEALVGNPMNAARHRRKQMFSEFTGQSAMATNIKDLINDFRILGKEDSSENEELEDLGDLKDIQMLLENNQESRVSAKEEREGTPKGLREVIQRKAQRAVSRESVEAKREPNEEKRSGNEKEVGKGFPRSRSLLGKVFPRKNQKLNHFIEAESKSGDSNRRPPNPKGVWTWRRESQWGFGSFWKCSELRGAFSTAFDPNEKGLETLSTDERL